MVPPKQVTGVCVKVPEVKQVFPLITKLTGGFNTKVDEASVIDVEFKLPPQYTVPAIVEIPAPPVDKYKLPAVLAGHGVGLVSLKRQNLKFVFGGSVVDNDSEANGVLVHLNCPVAGVLLSVGNPDRLLKLPVAAGRVTAVNVAAAAQPLNASLSEKLTRSHSWQELNVA